MRAPRIGYSVRVALATALLLGPLLCALAWSWGGR